MWTFPFRDQCPTYTVHCSLQLMQQLKCILAIKVLNWRVTSCTDSRSLSLAGHWSWPYLTLLLWCSSSVTLQAACESLKLLLVSMIVEASYKYTTVSLADQLTADRSITLSCVRIFFSHINISVQRVPTSGVFICQLLQWSHSHTNNWLLLSWGAPRVIGQAVCRSACAPPCYSQCFCMVTRKVTIPKKYDNAAVRNSSCIIYNKRK